MFSRSIRMGSIIRSLLICLMLVVLYNGLVAGGMLPPSNGVNQWQSNLIKVQRYVYQKEQDIKLILVGSSLTERLNASDLGPEVANLGMGGMSTQTGIEVVRRAKVKPPILLAEINDTIRREMNADLIGMVYNSFSYYLRLYVPSFREEYRPISVFYEGLKKRNTQGNSASSGENGGERTSSDMFKRFLGIAVKEGMQPLSESEKQTLKTAAESIKAKIAEIKKAGVRVVLYDVPAQKEVAETVKQKQVRQLMQELFPSDTYEWLPSPPAREWRTTDGVHLIRSHARDYALFLREQLLNKAS